MVVVVAVVVVVVVVVEQGKGCAFGSTGAVAEEAAVAAVIITSDCGCKTLTSRILPCLVLTQSRGLPREPWLAQACQHPRLQSALLPRLRTARSAEDDTALH